MELSYYIILFISILMYAEGAVVGLIAGTASKQSKPLLGATILLWPIALPIISYKLYKTYWPLVANLLPLLSGPTGTEGSGDEA